MSEHGGLKILCLGMYSEFDTDSERVD
jgi:hypothetical protein